MHLALRPQRADMYVGGSPEQDDGVLIMCVVGGRHENQSTTTSIVDCGAALLSSLHHRPGLYYLLAHKVLEHGTFTRRLTTDHGDLRQVQLHVNAQ